jgi:nitrate reductase gamma subunit
VTKLPYLVCYVAFIVFAAAVLARIIRWSRLPMHVRWELYPIAHDPANDRQRGSSYMEGSEWWTRPRRTSRLNELKVTLREILLLDGIQRYNRPLWKRTFPFHLGLYLAGGAAGLGLLNGILRGVAPEILVGTAGEVARFVIVGLGLAGLVLGIVGALALLHRRLTLPALRNFTTAADIFNLAFFIVAFGSGLGSFALVDSDGERALAFAANLTSFNLIALPGTGLQVFLPTATVVLLSMLIAYVPLTHMSHFVGKYFAYHSIRWNDEPNLAGGPFESKIHRLLNYEVTWAAEHIRGDGKKTWLDVASEDPTRSEP